MAKSNKKQFQLEGSEEVSHKKGLIDDQNQMIGEFKVTQTSLDEQQEIYNLKLSTLQIVHSKNEKELASLEKDIAKKRALNSELENQISDLDHSIAVTKDSISVKQSDITNTEITIDALNKRINEAKNNLTSLNEDSKVSTRRLTELQSQVKGKESHVKELEMQIATQKTKLQTANEEVEKLFYNLLAEQKKESTLKQQRDLNAEKIKSLESEIFKTEKELSTLEAQIRAHTSEIATQEKAISSKKQRAFDQRKEFDRLVTLAANKEDTRDINKAELEELDRGLSHLNKDIMAKRDQVTRDEEHIKGQIEELRLKREEIDTIERGINRLNHEIDEAQSKISHNKNSLASDSIKISTLKKSLDELECQEMTLQDQLLQTNETRKFKAREIETLTSSINDLKEKVSFHSKELDQVTTYVDELKSQVSTMSSQKEKLENTLEHKMELLDEQTTYLEVLKVDLSDLEKEYTDLQIKAAHTSESNESKKSEIFRLDEKVKEHHFLVSQTREQVQSLLVEGKAVDIELIQRMENLFAEEKRAELIKADVQEYLKGICKDKEKREQAYLKTIASFTSLTKDLKEMSESIIKNKKIIRERGNHISEKSDQIKDLSTKVFEARKRNKSYEKTLKEQEQTLSEQEEKIDSLQAESIILITQEEGHTKEIEKQTQSIKRLNEHREKLSVENKVRMKNVNELNTQLQKLQKESEFNKKAISEFKVNSKELTTDIQALEATVAEYEAQIKMQKDYYRQNSNTVKTLTSQNQILIERVQRLESVLEDYQNKNRIASQEIQTLEANKKKNELRLHTASHEASQSGADLHSVEELVEAGKNLEVNFAEQVRSLQVALEKQFFNLTIAPVLGDISFVDTFEGDQMSLFEDIHKSLISTVEDKFSKEAEMFVSFDVTKKNIRSSISVTQLEGLTNDVAKKTLVPITSDFLKRFKSRGLALSFKVKLKPNGTIDKLRMIIQVPLVKEADLKVQLDG